MQSLRLCLISVVEYNIYIMVAFKINEALQLQQFKYAEI